MGSKLCRVTIFIILLLFIFAVVNLYCRGRAESNVVRTCSRTALSIEGNKICLN